MGAVTRGNCRRSRSPPCASALASDPIVPGGGVGPPIFSLSPIRARCLCPGRAGERSYGARGAETTAPALAVSRASSISNARRFRVARAAVKVCVATVNYRTAETTIRAVEHALADLDGLGSMIVVDNASGDGSLARLRE